MDCRIRLRTQSVDEMEGFRVSIADEFCRALDAGMAELSTDEWAVTKAREHALIGLKPSDAFGSIVEVLNLAGQQTDEYAFASCCWFVMDLARLSDTTEPPSELNDVLVSLRPVAEKFEAFNEIKAIANWYRLRI
jgi:hypothetical protein